MKRVIREHKFGFERMWAGFPRRRSRQCGKWGAFAAHELRQRLFNIIPAFPASYPKKTKFANLKAESISVRRSRFGIHLSDLINMGSELRKSGSGLKLTIRCPPVRAVPKTRAHLLPCVMSYRKYVATGSSHGDWNEKHACHFMTRVKAMDQYLNCTRDGRPSKAQ
jgi:hypothetical protein